MLEPTRGTPKTSDLDPLLGVAPPSDIHKALAGSNAGALRRLEVNLVDPHVGAKLDPRMHRHRLVVGAAVRLHRLRGGEEV